MSGYMVILVLCTVFGAFYAAAETSYNFANANRIADRAEEGKGLRYRAADFVLKHYDFALSAGLVGVNVAHFGMSACATVALYRLMTASMGAGAEQLAASLATVITTVFVLVVCEILPKTFASTHSDLVAAWSAPVMVVSMVLLSPVVLLINGIVWLIRKPLGEDAEQPVTGDQLAAALEQSEQEGGMEEEKSELIQSAIEFPQTDIRKLIVPRVDMLAFDLNDGVDALIEVVRGTTHSRIPVYTETVDRITGVLYANLFLCELAEHGKENVDFTRCIKEPCFIYPSASLPDALEQLRKRKVHLAVVPDEYGGTMGIVTMEDILEELVGDIDDETDPDEPELVPVREDLYEVNGDLSVYDALEEIGADRLADTLDSDYTTVGGWAIEGLDGFPEVGKSFEYQNLRVTVTEMDGLRVTKVRFEILPTEDDGEQ